MIARWLTVPLMALLLGACAPEPEPIDTADAAAQVVLELYANWDEARARELWGESAWIYESRFAWFREQVGACSSFSPLKVYDERAARYVYDCEGGQFELSLRIVHEREDGERAVRRTFSGVRGVDPPVAITNTAKALLLATDIEQLGELETVFPKLRRGQRRHLHNGIGYLTKHGPCHIDRVHLASKTGALFVLECADRTPTMLVDLDRHGELRRFKVIPKTLDTWRED